MRSEPFSPTSLKRYDHPDSPTLTKRRSIKQIITKQSLARQILDQYNRDQNSHQLQNGNKNYHSNSIKNINRVRTPAKQQFIIIEQPIVDVYPKHYLQFQCTQFQISATLRMYINQNALPSSTYKFNLKSTNKQDYIVTEPSGQLKYMQQKVIYFYLKQNASINKNLKDKFLLEITEHRKSGEKIKIYAKKLTILIQCAINNKSPQINAFSNLNASSINNNNISRYLSIYMTPNAQQNPKEQLQRTYISRTDLRNSSANSLSRAEKLSPKSRDAFDKKLVTTHLSPLSPLQFTDEQREYKDALNPNQRDIDISRNSQKMKSNAQNDSRTPKFSSSQLMRAANSAYYDPQRLQKLHLYQQDLKTDLNQTIQSIQKKKRKKMILEGENKSTKARARFRIYLTITMVVLAFMFGMFIKSLGIKQGISNAWERAEKRLSKYWDTENQVKTDKETNSKETVIINEGPILNQYTQTTL